MVSGISGPGAAPAPQDDDPVATAAAATTSPLSATRTGPAARTGGAGSTQFSFKPEREYLPALLPLIANAQKSIDMVQYNFFTEKGAGLQIADALIARKKADPSVQIRVFMEGDHGDAATRNLTTMKKLQAAGIDVELDSKNLITHAKAVCVDDRYVLAGSTNMTDTSITKNNEVNLLFDSPAIAKQYESYFSTIEKTPSALDGVDVQTGPVRMVTDDKYESALLDTINSAKTSLDATMYDFDFSKSDPQAQAVMSALVAAGKRGVKIRLYLEQSNLPSEAGITATNQKAAAYLKAHGVPGVYFDPPDKITHAKFIVRDGQEVLMGSSNWTRSDFDQRHQINWDVQSPGLAKQMSDWLTNKIDTESDPPTAPPAPAPG